MTPRSLEIVIARNHGPHADTHRVQAHLKGFPLSGGIGATVAAAVADLWTVPTVARALAEFERHTEERSARSR